MFDWLVRFFCGLPVKNLENGRTEKCWENNEEGWIRQ